MVVKFYGITMNLHLLIFVACIVYPGLGHDDDYTVVRTKGGLIRGRILKLGNGEAVAAFLGVSFAEPPVGDLRFKAPVPLAPWNDTYDATDFGPLCVQSKIRVQPDIEILPSGEKQLSFLELRNFSQSEDCLNMNIYVPAEALPERGNNVKPLSILFFIHGGSYKTNGGRFYPGEMLASHGHVIVVTVNYRLGVLGFLSTADSSAKGNYGLLDQILALEWIRDNIEAFGGNSTDVTIFGNSAGGACVGLHLISPMSRGLFSKAIVQSGSPLGQWAVQRNPRKYVERLARKLNCSGMINTLDMVECLRTISPENIIQKSEDSAILASFPQTLQDSLMVQFAPTIDEEFLLSHPINMLQQEGSLGSVHVMVGVTRDEFEEWMTRSSDPSATPFTKDLLRKYLLHLVRKDHVSDITADVLLHAVYTEYVYRQGTTSSHHKKRRLQQEMSNGTAPYVENPSSALPDIRTLAKIISDIDLKAPSVQLVSLLALHPSVSVYMYEFDYASMDDVFVNDGKERDSKKTWVGSYHASELYYIFGFPHMNITNALRLDEDKEVANIMIQLWSDFAKTGNPTPWKDGEISAFQNFTWLQYTEEEEYFATLGLLPFVARSYESDRMAFWNHFIPLFTEYPLTISSNRSRDANYNLIECMTKQRLFLVFAAIFFIFMCLIKFLYWGLCRTIKGSREFPIPV